VALKNNQLEIVKNAPPEILPQGDETFRLIVEGVQDYAIFLLSPEGIVMTWNKGAEQIKGYKPAEIIGQHFSTFYLPDAKESGWPARELELARAQGRFADEGWRMRKDGSSFWANVVITAINGPDGEFKGFSKVTRDLTERRALEERSQQLNKELRARMTQLLESRSQLELRTLELQRLSGLLLNIQDEERRRIARELHDDLGQELIALKMSLEAGRRDRNPDDHKKTIGFVDNAMAKIRNLSYLLHPPLLDEAGLIPAIHWYLEGFRKRSELRITLDCKPGTFPRLAKEIETTIFRIVQECVTNLYRHSGSSDGRVEIHLQTDRVMVRVRDFGKGIEGTTLSGNLPSTSGVGIAGMRERLKQFGGELRIFKAEPGAIVEATIPLFQLAHID
jgi:PAS domain S-box-containing protein